jgi:translation elongation factor EF-Tu-like GTPase
VTDDGIEVVVEDAFRIDKRGVVVAPHFEPGRLPRNSELTINVVHQDGQSEDVRGRFFVEHVRLLDGGGTMRGVICVDMEQAGVVKPGDRITARVVK